ncbi:hypothetical protein GCM10023159_10390 [Brevibacterium yomogidense]
MPTSITPLAATMRPATPASAKGRRLRFSPLGGAAPGMPGTRGPVDRAGSVRPEDDRLRGGISSIVHEMPQSEMPEVCRFGDNTGIGPLANIPQGGIR